MELVPMSIAAIRMAGEGAAQRCGSCLLHRGDILADLICRGRPLGIVSCQFEPDGARCSCKTGLGPFGGNYRLRLKEIARESIGPGWPRDACGRRCPSWAPA